MFRKTRTVFAISPPGISRFRRFCNFTMVFTFSKSGVPPTTENFPPFFEDVPRVLLIFYKKKRPKRKGHPKIGVLDLDSIGTESATMGADCEPDATRGTRRPGRTRPARGTTRKTLLLAATPSLGRKLPASARIPTTP